MKQEKERKTMAWRRRNKEEWNKMKTGVKEVENGGGGRA